ncbi:MAG: hypothetical protein LC749_15250 [Actinobacteria bacterium]|nr:hypothetical protein [Actinomycetota bacterium]
MSEENVAAVRKGIEAFNCHDVEAAQALCTEDFELVPMRGALEETSYSGPNAGPIS